MRLANGCEVDPRLLARFDRVTDSTHKVESAVRYDLPLMDNAILKASMSSSPRASP
jgi:hypothetical protein